MARLRASEEAKGGLDSDEDDELTLITYHKAHALKVGDRIEVDHTMSCNSKHCDVTGHTMRVPATYQGNDPENSNFGRVILDMHADLPAFRQLKTIRPFPSKYVISRK